MKYIIFVIALFMTVFGWSQDLNYQIRGRITNQDVGSNLGGVTVSIVSNGATIASSTTSSNGKYSVNAAVPKNSVFTIVYAKAGMVSKKITVDASKINEEDLPAGNEVPLPTLDLDLFGERDNVDFSFLDSQPVAEFEYNTRKGGMVPDLVASEAVKKKINDLLLKADKDKMEADMKYQQAIQAAAAAEGKEEYEEAIAKYEEALTYKPTEQMPANKIVELEALLQAQQQAKLEQEQKDREYNNLIEAADNLRDQDKLAEAVSKYKEALTKKNEQYPKDQISALEAQIEQRKKEVENQAAYDELIKKGDMFLKQNSLKTARDKFTEASKLKPSEQYPKDKLAEIEKKMKEAEEKEALKKQYDDAIAAGDGMFDAENYEGAKEKYEEALAIENSSTYAKGRIAECTKRINEANAAKELEEKIANLLKEGNDAIPPKNYDVAKAKFEEVLTLDSENAEAKEKLAMVLQKMEAEAEELAKKKQFDDLVAEGDNAVSSENFDTGISKYEEALNIMSSSEVEAKLKDAREKKQALEQAAAKKADYDKAMEEGEALLISGNLEDAKQKFQTASSIDPTQQAPKDKIEEINKMLADQKEAQEQQAKYDAAITKADNLYNAKDWKPALDAYKEAIELQENSNGIIDGGTGHAQQRVVEIENILKEESEAAELKAQIEGLIAEASSLYNQKKLEAAKGKYEEVLKLDPANQIASDEINKINNELAAMKDEQEREEAFNKLRDKGYALADQKKYNDAKLKLQEALTLKEDAAVSAKIQELNALIQSEQDAQALDEQYDNAISQAQSLESANDLNGAISKYQEASNLKPSESMPKQKIEELKQKLKDNQALAEQQAIDDQYSGLMNEAAALEASNDLTGAISKYQQASQVKPAEAKPKDKIKELQSKIQSNADQAKIDEEYNQHMKRGNELMAQEKYLDAIAEFNNANALKPTEQEPVDKAAEAARLEQAKGAEADEQYEKILTVAEKKLDEGNYDKAIELANRAKNLKPTDPRPDKLMQRIEQRKKIDADFNKLMSEGDALALNKEYAKAKLKYQQASSKKPEEQLPKDKIAQMDKLINDAELSAQADELYNDYMMNGSRYQTQKKYDQALSEFQNALSVKPGDVPAQNKINEIQQILDDIANANQANIDKKNEFNRLVKEADVLFSAPEYLKAKGVYEQALMIDPSSSYVKKQIEECVRLEREKSTREEDAKYQKVIDAADKNFDAEDYEKAKTYYNRALMFRSYDPYPKQKLAEIEAILNPAMAQSYELTDLGDPYDGSILDGQALLEKADEERKLAKGNKIKSGIDEIYDAETEMTLDKTDDHRDNSNEIYMIQQKIARDEGEADLGRQATVDALRAAELELQQEERNNITYEHSENVLDQNVLYAVNEDYSIDYGERHSVYEDNADLMKTYNTAQADRIAAEIETDKDRNINADQELIDVKLSVDEGIRDDYAERAEVRDEVVAIEKRVVDIHVDKRDNTYDKLLNNKDEVRQIELAYDEKTVEDARSASDNNEEMKVVKTAVADMEKERTDIEEDHLYATDEEITDVKRKAAVEQHGMDESRKESVEILKAGNKEFADAHYNEYNEEMAKYIANKEYIATETENNGISDQIDEAHEKKVDYVDRMDKKAHIDAVDGTMSDEEERLNAKNSIEVVYTGVQETAKEELAKKEENSENLKDVSRTIEADKTNQAIGEQEKHYDASAVISDIDNTPDEKIKAENELGKEYPEGVSQEQFTQSDQNGLMTAIITRRIVVVDGHADVYVRTQTLHGITYSKNGKPSLQHVWNKETQGPHLERHY
jgi:tetratricopeptide (TPR) repeat protein